MSTACWHRGERSRLGSYREEYAYLHLLARTFWRAEWSNPIRVKDKPRKLSSSRPTSRVVIDPSWNFYYRVESSWNRLLYRGVNKRAKCRNKGMRLWKLREIILGLDEISKRVGYLDPTFPTRAKSGYEGMRIVYTRVTQARNQLALALFLPVPPTALFYPHFPPFLSLSL